MVDSDMSALIVLFLPALFLLWLLVEGARHYLRCRDLRAQIRLLDTLQMSEGQCRWVRHGKKTHEQ